MKFWPIHNNKVLLVNSLDLHLTASAQALSVFQLGFEGWGVPGRALFAWSYKNKDMCHVMCLVLRPVTKYNTIPQ